MIRNGRDLRPGDRVYCDNKDGGKLPPGGFRCIVLAVAASNNMGNPYYEVSVLCEDGKIRSIDSFYHHISAMTVTRNLTAFD